MSKNGQIEQRIARLRGGLDAEEPGARGLERVARNPACARLKALTMIGVTPSTAAAQIYQEPVAEGQSPFAIAIGNRFERELFENGAAGLLDLLRSAGILSETESKVVIIPDLAPNPSVASMARRRIETARLFRMKVQGAHDAPNIIIKPRTPVALLGVPHDVEPDALVAGDADRFYTPIEIKSYPHREGKTDPADVRSACRQAAVGVIALRDALARMGVTDVTLSTMAHLVLRVPGMTKGRLTSMAIESEVDSLLRAIREAPRNLDELESFLAFGEHLDSPEVLDSIPNNYRGSCREHCALWRRCKASAISIGDPVLLGDTARELFAPAGSIHRAADLLFKKGAIPRTSDEASLAVRLQEAYLLLKVGTKNGR